MSKSKHSPGKWYWKKGVDQMVNPGTTLASLGMRSNAHYKCFIFTDSNFWGEMEADARLMAKAPEMYNLLCDVLSDHEAGLSTGTIGQIKNILTEIEGE